MTLLDVLPRGRANATSIPALASLSGLPEREVRQQIADLVVLDHVPVVCLPTARGVFVATTPEEVDQAQASIRSRAMELLRRARGLRMARESLVWSPTLFD